MSFHNNLCILIFQNTLNNVKSSIKEFTQRTNPDLSITAAVLSLLLSYVERSAEVSNCWTDMAMNRAVACAWVDENGDPVMLREDVDKEREKQTVIVEGF